VESQNIYATYDKDGNGVLTGDELRSAMTGMGVEPPPPPQVFSKPKEAMEQQESEPDVTNTVDPDSPASPMAAPTAQGLAENESGGRFRIYHELMSFLSSKAGVPANIDTLA
jgi:hypothetical protein